MLCCFIKDPSLPPPPTESFHLLGERRGSLWMRGKPITGQSPALRPRKRPLGEGPQGEAAGAELGSKAGFPEAGQQQRAELRGADRAGGETGGVWWRGKRRGKSQGRKKRWTRSEGRLPVTAYCKDTPLSPTQQRQRQQGPTPPSPPTISLLLALLEYRRWQTAKTDKGSRFHLLLDTLCTEQRGTFSITGHLNH